MPSAEQIAEKAGQLRALQTNWESIKRNASAELQTLASGQGQYTDNAQEQLRAQIANAAFRLEQIAQELNRIARLQEEQARQDAIRQEAQREQSSRDNETAPPETARKDELAREEREKAEAFQKEQEQKADALDKERQDKEFFENKERERLEALQKEERDKQEIEKQEVFKKEEIQQKEGQSDLDFLGEQLMDINQEWQYIQDQIDAEWKYIDDQIAAEFEYINDQIEQEWQYIDDQINEEMEYNVEQTIEAVVEAVDEVALAIRNPVSERESGKFLEEKAKELEAFMRTEDFQGQSADTKARFLEDRIKEQLAEAKEKFGDRGDEFGNREKMKDKLGTVHEIARETVERDKQNDKQAREEIEQLKKMAAKKEEQIRSRDYDEARKAVDLEKLAEFVRMKEQMIRDGAERRSQEIYKEMKLLEEERERERQRQIEATRAAALAASRQM